MNAKRGLPTSSAGNSTASAPSSATRRILERQLTRFGVDRLSAVVSSLPIKWFPREAQRAVLRPCFARLGSDGRFLQLTTAFSSPLPIEALGLDGGEAARVWRNVPPAQIWAYTAGSGGSRRRTP